MNNMDAKELQKQTEFIIHPTSLTLELPEDLADKPLCRLRTLSLQKDSWSCGYHAIFNARAIEQAVQEKTHLEESLKKNLANQKLFEETFATAQAHTKENKPLHGQEIAEICKTLSLQDKAISLFLTDKNELMIPSLFASVEHQKTASKQEIEALLHSKRKELVSNKIAHLVKSLKNNGTASYFICNTGNHWVLFSMIRNQDLTKLYLIGAWNEPINDAMRVYINKLLEYLQLHNEKKLVSFILLFSQCGLLLG
jgi:hypothetical protein